MGKVEAGIAAGFVELVVLGSEFLPTNNVATLFRCHPPILRHNSPRGFYYDSEARFSYRDAGEFISVPTGGWDRGTRSTS